MKIADKLGRECEVPGCFNSAHRNSLTPYRILYICLEFSRWQQARSWSYQTGLGLEEGFDANGISYITVPALQDLVPGDPAAWVTHLAEICEGKQFDQVWVEVVHNNLDDRILSYIATLAPVRLALLGESLTYPDDVYCHAPALKNRREQVVSRLKYMTHALAGDERDAEWLNAQGVVKALWWVQGIPAASMCRILPPPTENMALFSGALYGEREDWLKDPRISGLLAHQQPLEEEAQLPEMFDQTNAKIAEILGSHTPFSEGLLTKHLALLRQIRRQSFTLWLKGLSAGSSVVNLPSFYQGYAGRIYEGMAAGRPVISWEIPDRPRTRALFENGTEILLFSKDNPVELAQHVQRVQREPEYAHFIATNARNRMLVNHTLEKSIARIMQWIVAGEEPGYEDMPTESTPAQNSVSCGVPQMSGTDNGLTITTVSLQSVRQRGEHAVASGNAAEAISIYSMGARLFPKAGDLWQQLRRLSHVTGNVEMAHRAAGKIADIISEKNQQDTSNPPQNGNFFTQKIQVNVVDDRMAILLPLCSGKKVLHVGCTDNPLFDPSTNLHIQLSKVCRQLDGLDVDVEGIEILRQYVDGRYFTDTRQVADEYDVLLVPETIEHVDNIRDFLESLSAIRFKQCLITAPNAFLPNDNGNHWENPGEYVEYVHPDHNTWFSPYTLKNCITKFTRWKVCESYLIGNFTMVGCLCERQQEWELKKIPKKVHFYWGNDTISFLRYASVYSFHELNPDWEINIYLPAENYKGEVPWVTGEKYDGTGFKGNDYSEELFSLPGIAIKEVDFSAFPHISAAPENYKSDFFRWHILSTEGGVYSDIDLLYFRPMNELYSNSYENRGADCCICLQSDGNIIGFLLSAPDNEFFGKVFDASIHGFDTTIYQSISAPLVNQLFPSMASIHAQLPDLKCINMPMDVVYALDHNNIPDIFLINDLNRLTEKTIGIHWYAGHPVSQSYNNLLTAENFQDYPSILTSKLGDVMKNSKA